MFSQQAPRQPWERKLSQHELEALDRARAKEIQNKVENPALWAALQRIEAKLDKLLAIGDRTAAS